MSQQEDTGTVYSVHIQENNGFQRCATKLLQVKSFIMNSISRASLSVIAILSFIVTHLRSTCEVLRREHVWSETEQLSLWESNNI